MQTRNTDELIPYINNARTHSDDQIAQIAASIKEFGFLNPIIVDGENGIIAGHGRLAAANRLGLKSVPIIEAAHLSEAQKKADVIADNQLATTAGWDNDLLKVEIADLQAMEFDTDLLGFDADFINGLMAEPTQGLTDEDEVPEPPAVPITVRGDVWILGNHRLMCGDSTSIEDVERLMDGVSADVVFTDPPYNTGMDSKNQRGGAKARLSHMFDDNYTPEQWQQFMSDFIASSYYVLKENTAAYICLDWRRNHELVPHIKTHFDLSNTIVWDKVVHGLGSDYKYTYELINVCKKGKPELDTHQGDREYSDVWHIQRKVGRNKDHATAKPVELVERCLRHASKPNALCVDIFCGSGTTLIACEKTNRLHYGMELSEAYCDVIIKRWQDFTGKKAIHENGTAFDDMKREVA